MSLRKKIMSFVLSAIVASSALAVSALSVSAATVSEKEDNNTMATANAITVGNTVNGSISANDTKDFYKITLSSSGCLKVNLNAYMEYVYFNVYDENGDAVYNNTPYWNSNTEKIVANYDLELTKGTYYIAISAYGNRFGNYSIKATLVSANESFVETGWGTNNNMEKASSIKLNTEYKGQIAINDDKDFYKISLPSSGCMLFDLTAYMEYISFKVYNSDGEEIYSHNPYWNGNTGKISSKYYLDFTKGDYYISLSKYSNRSGSYYFMVSFTESKESFIETGWGTNNNMESANRIELGKKYSGQIAWNDNKDFYKVKVSTAGTYKFVINSTVEYMYMEIYDSEAKCLISNGTSWRGNNDVISKEYSIDLTPSEYYVAFTRNGNHFGTYNFYLAAPGATITDATASNITNNSLISATEINLGSTFTVVGAATGGTKCYQYAFFYKKTTDKSWTTKQNFSSNPSVSIKPAKAVTYDVCVKIRDEMGKEAKKYFKVNVSPKLTNNSTVSATSIKLGSSVTANCVANGGSTFYKYSVFYKKKSETNWTLLQNFGTNAKVVFKPSAAGDYDICVKVVDSRTSASAAPKKYFTLKVTK